MQSNRNRFMYAHILTTRVLSVWPIIARCNEFCVPFDGFQSYKKDSRVVLNGCEQGWVKVKASRVA